MNIIGDVNDVIEGTVREGTADKWYSANQFLVGIGASSPTHLESLGEAYMFNGFAYTLSTDPNDRYFETITGRSFLTSFTIGLPVHSRPNLSMRFTSGHNGDRIFDLNALYTRLNDKLHGKPFCYYGLFRFKRLHSVSVSKAPIYGENLFGEHHNDYYSQPAFDLRNVVAVTAGCAANFSSIADDNLRAQLSRALYVNPLDNTSDHVLSVHSHAITLKGDSSYSMHSLRDITPDMVSGVYHMLSGSVISECSVHAFQVNGIRDITDLYVTQLNKIRW